MQRQERVEEPDFRAGTTSIRAHLTKALGRTRDFAKAPAAQRMLSVLQYALLAGIVAYLIGRLSGIGWAGVIDALPTSPLFYLIFLVRYFAPPLTELVTYEIVWRRSLWRHFSAFIRKRVYNFAVMGYSGEAFFTLWARRALDLSDREILIGVKDNNLISALVSNAATALLVFALFMSGRLTDNIDVLPGASLIFAIAFASALGLAVAVAVFRRKIMDLPRGVMTKLVAINAARVAMMLTLQAILYWSALPAAPIDSWFIFIALQLVLTRMPFVPNPDIVFLTAALHFSSLANVTEAGIAGMLVAEAGLSQILNLTLFTATAHLALKQRPPRLSPAAFADGAGGALTTPVPGSAKQRPTALS
jgi:hypothetical protein